MKVLVVKPNQIPYEAEIRDSLEDMQALVGGLIQAVYPFDEPVALVCNDEGKLLGLPLNRALRKPDTGAVYDIVAGTFFLCGCPPEAEHFTSLTTEQLARYANHFHSPESFIRVGQEIMVLPREEAAV